MASLRRGVAWIGVVWALALGAACDDSSDGSGTKFELPSCVKELTKDCPPDGVCGEDVMVSVTGGLTCNPEGPNERVTEVKRPDGTLCYTLIETLNPETLCEGPALTWKDPSGEVVAHGGAAISIGVVCNATGESSTCRPQGGPDCATVAQTCKEPG